VDFPEIFAPKNLQKHVPRETIPRVGNGSVLGHLAASVRDQKHAKSGTLMCKSDAKAKHYGPPKVHRELRSTRATAHTNMLV
jgi:hypothetical protein